MRLAASNMPSALASPGLTIAGELNMAPVRITQALETSAFDPRLPQAAGRHSDRYISEEQILLRNNCTSSQGAWYNIDHNPDGVSRPIVVANKLGIPLVQTSDTDRTVMTDQN